MHLYFLFDSFSTNEAQLRCYECKMTAHQVRSTVSFVEPRFEMPKKVRSTDSIV